MPDKYRKCVGIMILNNQKEILVARRLDHPSGFWQMPQGGIDKNENFLEAAKRELKEETGVKTVKIIKELNSLLTYDLPKHLLGKIWQGKYRGQKQKWFIMKFLGHDKEINIETKDPEFIDWKWIKVNDLPKVAVNFKVDIYNKIRDELFALNLN